MEIESKPSPSPAEVAQLRAELRRRKILERRDERFAKLLKESKDESELSRSESVEERNKNLLDEIKRDPKVLERIGSIEAQDESADSNVECRLTNGTACNQPDRSMVNRRTTVDQSNSSTSGLPTNPVTGQPNDDSANLNGPISSISSQTNQNATNGQPKGKPTIDLSYFERMEKKEKRRQEKLAITRFQLLLIHLVSIVTLQSDAILLNLFKFLIAILSSYLCLNIVTPFIIAQSIALFYTGFLRTNASPFSLALSYGFVKRTLLDSLSFFFIYTLVQTFMLET